MSQFVLVHGAFLGGWLWRRVLPLLREAGHRAHAVTLTGCGERAHLMSPGIRLRTHVDDVLGLIAAEELDDIVLVGHSYAGVVVTGVADALLQSAGPVLRALVYVDAAVPHPGESWSSGHAPATVAGRLQAARASGGTSLPPPDPADWGLEGADLAWCRRRVRPQPFGVYQDPLVFDAERLVAVPRTFIDCPAPALATIDAARRRVREEPGWQVETIPTGHLPMVSAPEALATLLLRAAAARH